jgi:glycosidase
VASEFFINQENRISVSAFDSLLLELREAYPGDISYVQQNLYDSHDTQRFTSFLVNHDIARFRTWGAYFDKTKATNPDYKVRKPYQSEYRIQRLMALFQFTYVGAPMVYYGDEVGMWGANDPDCRKPMVWDDLTYADEVFNTDGSIRTPDEVTPDMDLFDWYASLAAMRKEYPALSRGQFETLLVDDINNVYVFRRSLQGERPVIVVLNNSHIDQVVPLGQWLQGDYASGLEDSFRYTFSDEQSGVLVPYASGLVLIQD